MKLHELSPAKGSRTAPKRKGRGVGTGNGKTAGRGTKGFKSRSGGNVRPGFEGGQMPIHRRLPKRGFTNIFRKKIAEVNLRDLNRFEQDSTVDEIALRRAGLIKGALDGIKLLGQGELNHPLKIKVNKVSAGARQKVEAAGGSIEVLKA
ncbi:MAG: 50S ribosomal protein L15 [Desulfobacterales bacterium]|nr:50S ribosomal protein L15 [Desulfobacterales bacterium]